MIERIAFENFRGFQKIELTELKPVTLISGKNNAGKSSVLEGIFLFLDHLSPEAFLKINRFRGFASPADSVSLWESAFYQMNVKNSLRISAIYEGAQASLEYMPDYTFVPPVDTNVPQELMGQIISSAASKYTLKFLFQKGNYTEGGHFTVGPMGIVRSMSSNAVMDPAFCMPYTQFVNAAIINGNSDSFIAEWLGKTELAGRKQNIIEILKLIEPAIDDLVTIVANGAVQIFAKMGEQLLPFRLAGDGLNKLLFLILAIAVNPHSVVLIDEVETGFHYSMYSQLWNMIARTAYENDCQIIATTHSYECIVGAAEGIKKAGRSADFCYYRLDKNETGNYAYRYSDDLLQVAVTTDMEVR